MRVKIGDKLPIMFNLATRTLDIIKINYPKMEIRNLQTVLSTASCDIVPKGLARTSTSRLGLCKGHDDKMLGSITSIGRTIKL